jgi:GT2 family glycosyltransferase
VPPTVSVIMSVYNGERFLRAAIDSVLAQTLQDWELIVVDDASTDSTPTILAEYRDPRIRILRNQTNRKQAACSNRGIAVASGRYIARLDADDVSFPNRLEEQIRFLETHPDVTLLASAAYFVNEGGERIGLQPGGLNDCGLKLMLVVLNPLIHSTVVFRTDVARQLNGYDEDPKYWVTEDLEFLARIAFHGKAHVLPQPLVEYRVHPSSVSIVHQKAQQAQCEMIVRAVLKEKIGLEVDDVCRQAWQRFLSTKPGIAVRFNSEEVKRLGVMIPGLLRTIKHDPDGHCVFPWRWSKHALALAILPGRGSIPIGARLRFLILAVQIAIQKLIRH